MILQLYLSDVVFVVAKTCYSWFSLDITMAELSYSSDQQGSGVIVRSSCALKKKYFRC